MARTDFPNTNGQWARVDGFPLIEVKADGTDVSVGIRPAGFTSEPELATDADRAAFEFQKQGYVFGESAAAAYQASLGFGALTPYPADAPNEMRAAIDEGNKRSTAAAAAYTRTLSTGVYATPLPERRAPIDEQPIALAVAEASGLLPETDRRATALAITLDPPVASVTSSALPIATVLSTSIVGAVTHPDQLTLAQPIVASQPDSHLVVPRAHASFLRHLAAAVRAETTGENVATLLALAIEKLFGAPAAADA